MSSLLSAQMVHKVIPLSESQILEYSLSEDRIFLQKTPWCHFNGSHGPFCLGFDFAFPNIQGEIPSPAGHSTIPKLCAMAWYLTSTFVIHIDNESSSPWVDRMPNWQRLMCFPSCYGFYPKYFHIQFMSRVENAMPLGHNWPRQCGFFWEEGVSSHNGSVA